ncbi:MAG: hypothetical protein ACI8S6_004522 [Myxococcota bacterium]|jgi:hypothetical protein
MKAALWVIGGLCIGTGFLLALPSYDRIGGGRGGGFGVSAGGEYAGGASQVFATTGYDTVADIAIFSQGWMAIIVALTGMALLVYANANAWKETNGY